MSQRDVFIALSVVLIWAINLLVQKFLVGEISIFIVSFLRVALVAPLIFLFPRPKIPLKHYFIAGLFWGVLYLLIFGFALKSQLGAGVASFFLQTQVFFGILCCYLLLKEVPSLPQIFGIFLASLGISLMSLEKNIGNISPEGIVLLLGSCFCGGVGFALLKKYNIGKELKDSIWLSAVSAVPLLISCIFFEGLDETFDQLSQIQPLIWLGIIFAAYGSTFFSTYLWLGLAQRNSAAALTPFMLLLPIFSVMLSFFFMGEIPTWLQIMAGSVIIMGVMVSQNMHLKLFRFKEPTNSPSI